MITHCTKTNKVFSTGKNPKVQVIRGYYLVLPNGDRHWLGDDKYTASKALTKACDKYLTEATDWHYWIDYCYGLDVYGSLAWCNLDQSDVLLDVIECENEC